MQLRSLIVTEDRLGFRRVVMWIARWSRRLWRSLLDTSLARAGLLIDS